MKLLAAVQRCPAHAKRTQTQQPDPDVVFSIRTRSGSNFLRSDRGPDGAVGGPSSGRSGGRVMRVVTKHGESVALPGFV